MNPTLYNDIAYFFRGGDTVEERGWLQGMLRYGDQLPAVAYTFGITPFQCYQALFYFKDDGEYPEPYMPAIQQMRIIQKHKKRSPRGVLSIGEGRGELALMLSAIGVRTLALEPSAAFEEMLQRTSQQFKVEYPNDNLTALNYPLVDLEIEYVKEKVDTYLFVESLEHIEEQEFWRFWDLDLPGRYIFVNFLSYHPLIPDKRMDHVFRVDDALFDKLSKGNLVVTRNRSHLVLERG